MIFDLRRSFFDLRCLVVIACLALGCASANHENASGEDHEPAHWSYAGDEGPPHWADLSDAFGTCGTGIRQSPIDLRAAVPSDGHRVAWTYPEGALEVSYNEHVVDLIDNGHTIQLAAPGGSLLHLVDGDYTLAQLHFHAPSEHTVDGRFFPLEIHLVHQSASGRLAVVGVLVEPGERHDGLALLAENLPQEPGQSLHFDDVIVDIDGIVPRTGGYYTYSGSLTTPPCTEGVQWFVMEARMESRAEDIAAFTEVLHENHRPVQPLGARILELVRH